MYTEKKYYLTECTKLFQGITLHRIMALKDFGDVEEGQLGGWVQSEKNLSHEGDCWIYGNSIVKDNAVVKDNALVYGVIRICGDSTLQNNCFVKDNGFGVIAGQVNICGNATINTRGINIFDIATIKDKANIEGESIIINKNAIIGGNANVKSCTYISQDVILEPGEKEYYNGIVIPNKIFDIRNNEYINMLKRDVLKWEY